MRKMIKAVIFDMDGVLIDAKDWHYVALNRALHLFGYEISRTDHLTTFDGLPTLKKLEMLSVERGLPRKLHQFLNELKQKYTMEITHQSCRPRFTHEYALSMLKRRGLKLAVASNSIRNTVAVMMRMAALEEYLDLQLSNEDVNQAKPDPEIYQLAMDRLNVNCTEALIVEDNENGIRAARASGAHVMEVSSVDDVHFGAIVRRISEIEASR
jgi:beta-phosphoglucomutase